MPTVAVGLVAVLDESVRVGWSVSVFLYENTDLEGVIGLSFLDLAKGFPSEGSSSDFSIPADPTS